MKKLRKVQSQEYPKIFIDLNNSRYYYNYNIVEKEIVTLRNSDTKEHVYEYTPILIEGVPTQKNCIKAVIREYITPEEEFDLINSYNRNILLGEESIEDTEKYKEYLILLQEIKSRVKNDFNI